MAFLSDFFMGARPDMRLPGYAQGFLGTLQDYMGNINGGMSARQYKHDIKQFDKDPLSLASVSLAQGAVNEREANERTGQGANALLAQSGGEQANLLSHVKENERMKREEQTGLNAMQEAYGRRNAALQGLDANRNSQRQAELGTLGLMNSVMNQGYDARRRGGIFNPETWSGMLQSFAGGMGQRAGGAMFGG